MKPQLKLQFDKDLEYQHDAISSVVDLFRGQTPMQSNFTVSTFSQQIGMLDTTNGVGNKLELDEEEILNNLHDIQLRNGLNQTKKLKNNAYDFDVEMETGTGKTYVYLRTVFEMNKHYGFTKFIIVVPSLAIKEGVYTSLKITKDHFNGLYNNTIYNYFIYDSSKLEQVRSFAVSDNIEIMVINIDAFRKSFADPEKENKANLIHRTNDKLNGMKPIELIQETRPFVIIDEPQSVDSTVKAKEAIKSLNPLCIFRYSATHVEKHNQVYKLDAVDSYNLELVKQIEVAGFETKDYHNKAYLKLISVNNKKSPITAVIEIDKKNKKGVVNREAITVTRNTDLYEISGSRDVYEGYIVNEIYCETGNEYVSFTSQPDMLRINEGIGDVDPLIIKEHQIRKTIEEHLEKELILNKQGIKVLSLFFIDRVVNYRLYDSDGSHQKGIYAQLFEKHYSNLIKQPKYQSLLSSPHLQADAHEVHDGYFSIDKKGVLKDTSGVTIADESAYNLIMKDKEKLLSFDTKLRFIFSHSTLKEGWDNPNVFQICTLNDTKKEVKKRQEIGRGLRLCVNQKGERQHGFAINTLTVMANESYDDFAKNLQKEYEEEEGIRFGVLESHSFANIPVKQANGSTKYLGQIASEAIVKHFETQGYIDQTGNVQDSLKLALKNNSLDIPIAYESIKPEIIVLTRKACSSLNIKNNSNKKNITLNKAVYLDPEFKTLWERIKYKTTYSVDFDSDILINTCIKELKENLSITAPKLIYSKGILNVGQSGIIVEERDRIGYTVNNQNDMIPDIITYLQNETNLTRKTIVDILIKSDTIPLFKKNPQKYMEQTADIISSQLKLMIVDGIKYTKIGDDAFFAQELFETQELFGYLTKNMIPSNKSIYDYVVYDSGTEATFAEKMENNKHIKLYAKLPDWFKIPTPLGTYNPDWAIVIDKDGVHKIYFVVETKGDIKKDSLRPTEAGKIKCGKAHFEALENGIGFDKVDDFDVFIMSV